MAPHECIEKDLSEVIEFFQYSKSVKASLFFAQDAWASSEAQRNDQPRMHGRAVKRSGTTSFWLF
jgi:hypothetical protein